MKSILYLWTQWRASRAASKALDILLAQAQAQADTPTRHQWLVELTWWWQRPLARSGSTAGTYSEHARLRFFLQVLAQQPHWQQAVRGLLQTTWGAIDAQSLLCESGLARKTSLWGEVGARLTRKLIPPAVSVTELAALFELLFPRPRDSEWVARLPIDLQDQLFALCSPSKEFPAALRREFAIALQVLTHQVSAAGLHPDIRTRLSDKAVAALPFFALPPLAQRLFTLTDQDLNDSDLTLFQAQLDAAQRSLEEVRAHMDSFGISVAIVLRLELLLAQITRIESLLAIWVRAQSEPMSAHRLLFPLIAQLITANVARTSLRQLWRDGLRQIARKVVERNAEAGAHYIARDHAHYRAMLQMALGGGVLTAFTVYGKFMISGAVSHPFWQGFFSALNYAISFLVIYFAHFTLATKQPASTAPVIAHTLDQAASGQGAGVFVTEVLALIRSQMAAIVGNLVGVFPVALALSLLMSWWWSQEAISVEKAHDTLASFSIWGATPLYAAGTGVLLWLSSLIAGWCDNWFTLHRLHDVLRYQRRLVFLLGEHGAARVARFWQDNIAGISGNVSLGLLLGLVPTFITFFGLHFEVRHVTLSTGALAASLGVLGWSVLTQWGFWAAVLGIVSMAVLNLAVSFFLAFQMAIRSRQLSVSHRRALYRQLWQHLRRSPRDLFRA